MQTLRYASNITEGIEMQALRRYSSTVALSDYGPDEPVRVWSTAPKGVPPRVVYPRVPGPKHRFANSPPYSGLFVF